MLAQRIAMQREQLDRFRQISDRLEEHLARDGHLLAELDGILGTSAQLRLEALDERLRGQRLEEVAIEILRTERGPNSVVHYREWFDLLRDKGHSVSGKNPLGTFLAQINRSPAVES